MFERRIRPNYATRAEFEADTTWYWEAGQVGVVIGTVVIAICVAAFAYLS